MWIETDESHAIPVLHISEMHFSNYIRGTKTDWLEKEIPNIKESLKLFTDDRSRDIFTNIFCNKIYGSKSKADYEMTIQHHSYSNYTDTVLYADNKCKPYQRLEICLNVI
ncbi:MAG: hypothetical protein HFG86_15385 [Dorea sp.]|nr:hypothetical protein [Dorea sp.]